MALLGPDPEYSDYLRLRGMLRRDGTPVPAAEAAIGDYVYVSDGPRLIAALGEYDPSRDARPVCLRDTGGPITGGWKTVRGVFRGGRDHQLALTDSAETDLRRWQQQAGRKHPSSRRTSR